jgi:hypothetical protein
VMIVVERPQPLRSILSLTVRQWREQKWNPIVVSRIDVLW